MALIKFTVYALLKLIQTRDRQGWRLLMHLETIRLLGVAIAMVNFHHLGIRIQRNELVMGHTYGSVILLSRLVKINFN